MTGLLVIIVAGSDECVRILDWWFALFSYVQSNQTYFLQLHIPLRYCKLRDSNVNELFIKLAVN